MKIPFTRIQWIIPETFPLMEENDIHIWSLPFIDTDSREWYPLLSGSERDKMHQFSRPDVRRQFLSARTGMRLLFSNYQKCLPETIILEKQSGGKPIMTKPQPGLQFNLTHSGKQILLAISGSTELGIDVEKPLRPACNIRAIAARVFSPSVVDKIVHSAEPEKSFLYYWTEFESRNKRAGNGIFSETDEKYPVDVITRHFIPRENYLAAISFEQKNHPVNLRFFQANYAKISATLFQTNATSWT